MQSMIFWSCEYCGTKPDGRDANCPNCGSPRKGAFEHQTQRPSWTMTASTCTAYVHPWASTCQHTGPVTWY